MNRWTRFLFPPRRFVNATFFVAQCGLLTLALGAFHSKVAAQSDVRAFPAAALRGTLVVTQPPQVLLDRNPAQLSPGARIRGVNNFLVLSGTIAGQELVVNYVRDSNGQIHEVWILSDAEIAQKRPNTGSTFRFASEQDKPSATDGKTPYHLLPRFGAPAAPAPEPTPN